MITDLTRQPANGGDYEVRLTAALEHKPSIAISTDFAARVTARVQALPARTPRRVARYGQLATGISFAVLLLAMFALAHWAQPTFASFSFDLELLLLAQMLGLAAWQFLRYRVRPELSF